MSTHAQPQMQTQTDSDTNTQNTPGAANGTHGETRHTVVPSKMSLNDSSRAQRSAYSAPTDCPRIPAFPIRNFAQSCHGWDTEKRTTQARVHIFHGLARRKQGSLVETREGGKPSHIKRRRGITLHEELSEVRREEPTNSRLGNSRDRCPGTQTHRTSLHFTNISSAFLPPIWPRLHQPTIKARKLPATHIRIISSHLSPR